MRNSLAGGLPPRGRKARAVLTRRGPFLKTAISGSSLDPTELPHVEAYYKVLVAECHAWADLNRGGKRYNFRELRAGGGQ